MEALRIARDVNTARQHASTVREVYLTRADLFEVPDFIPELPHLELLDLSKNPIQALPEEMAQLSKLKTLILKDTQIPVVPEVLGKLESLEKLVLDGNKLPYLPDSLGNLKQLRALHLSRNALRTWPVALCDFPELSTLVLDHNQFASLPEAIASLSNLNYIDLRHNPLNNFPRSLAAITRLETIQLEDHPFSGPAEPNLPDVIVRFFRQTCGDRISPKRRQQYLDILLTNASDLANLPREQALQLLNAAFPDVKAKAPEALYQALPSPFSEEKPGSICMIGTFRELRQSATQRELKALGIATTAKPDGPGCVVICGERPGPRLKKALTGNFATGVEGHLADFLRQQQGEYLAQSPAAAPGSIDNLRQLLFPWNRDNIELALLLIDGGGLPGSLLSEVLALHLFHPAADLREKSGELFARFTTRGQQQYVARCQQNARLTGARLDVDALLRSLGRRPGLDPVALTRAALSQNAGLRYLLELPPEAQAQLWPHATRDAQLRLDRLDLDAFPESLLQLTQLRHLFLGHNALTHLPSGIHQMEGLQSLELENNHLEALPEALCALPGLSRLDLRGNRLRHLPTAFGQLKSLRGLRLDLNPLQELPASLAELSGLEMLSLHDSLKGKFPEMINQLAALVSLDVGDCKIEHLPASAGKLQQLQALNIPRNPIAHLPEWVGSLPRLRYLDLSYCTMQTLPESLAESKTLERIYLLRDDSMNWQQVTEVLAQIPSLQGVNFKHNRIAPKMQKHIEKHLDKGKRKVYYGN